MGTHIGASIRRSVVRAKRDLGPYGLTGHLRYGLMKGPESPDSGYGPYTGREARPA